MKIPVLTLLTLALLLILGCEPTFTTISAPEPVTKSPAPVTAPSPPVSTSPAPAAPVSTITSLATLTTASQPSPSLKLEDYKGGFFSIKKPTGWEIVTAGSCSTFAFCIRDKEDPANQIFYFNEVGPVYLAEEQKTVDKRYMDMGGYPVTWYEMPVVNPLTPENLLENFHLIARTDIAQKFMPGLPELQDIKVISMAGGTSPIPGGQTKTIRALFHQGGELGEGLFYITVAPLIPLTGMPSGGIGYGFCFAGITSAKAYLRYYESALTQSLNSLNISQAYINSCLSQQQQQYQGILKAGQTLSDTSDIIMDVWENRSRSEDIITEKMSDVILGNDRVYDPDTGTVYEVPPGFYDDYNIQRDQYKMDNLQTLPDDDWGLWTAPTKPADEID